MVLFALLLSLAVIGEASSESDFTGCLTEYTYGYAYLRYFPISEVIEDTNTSDHISLEVHVKASRDAHIFLSESKRGSKGYEIVLGGGSNTFSQIRVLDGRRKKAVKTARTANVVSSVEVRGFWIEIFWPGTILVGKTNNTVAILVYVNPKPFPVEYVSFSTWPSVMGEWFFACGKNTSGTTQPGNQTASQKLKSNLLKTYNPADSYWTGGRPNGTVDIHFDANYFQLDENRGRLLLAGIADVKWTDWKLMWNPEDYQNTSLIYLIPDQLWIPNVKILNSATFQEKRSLLRSRGAVLVTSTGDVTWRTPFRSTTACEIDYATWPFDQYNCSILLGFDHEPLRVQIRGMSTSKLPRSDWEVSDPDGTANREGVLRVNLRRLDTFIFSLLIVPTFVCAAALSLLSFWVTPDTPAKLFLNCGSLLILIAALIAVANRLPDDLARGTRIVHLYMWSIFMACCPVLLFIGVRYLPQTINPPQFFVDFLNSNFAEFFFCLPDKRELQSGSNDVGESNAVRLSVVFERTIFMVYVTALVISFHYHLFPALISSGATDSDAPTPN